MKVTIPTNSNRVVTAVTTNSQRNTDVRINTLLDVDITTNGLEDGFALIYDVTTGKWIAQPELNDVFISTIVGTQNQIEVDTAESTHDIVISLPDNVILVGDLTVGGNDIKSSDGTTALTLAVSTGNVTVAGDLTVGGNDIKSSDGTVALSLSGANVQFKGNITVSGSTTTVNSTTLTIRDPLIFLANNNTVTDVVDIGLYGTYDTSGTQDLFTGFFRDASDDKWKLFNSLQEPPTTTVDTSGTGYSIATLIANLESASVAITGGSITGITDITVADGGTGVSTFTSNGIVYGNGSSALQVTAAGASGYILYSNAGTPAWTNTLDAGEY